MKHLRLIFIVLLSLSILSGCGGGGGGASGGSDGPGPGPGPTPEKSASLQFSSQGLIPVVDANGTRFSVYVTNIGTGLAKDVNWSLDNLNAGFKIIDSSAATAIAPGQTTSVLIEAGDAGVIGSTHLVASFNKATDLTSKRSVIKDEAVYNLALNSYKYTSNSDFNESHILIAPNLGIINTSAGDVSYGFYIINQADYPISSISLKSLPSNISFQLGNCPNPLPAKAVCQITLNIKQDATSGDGGSLTNLEIIPTGTKFGTTNPLPTQHGGNLTLDSRIVGNAVLAPITGFKIDLANNIVESGVGYIVNAGVKPITVSSITTNNDAITVINNCTQVAPGDTCSYSITANLSRISAPGNVLITVNYSNSKVDEKTAIAASWSYVPPKVPDNPKLEFEDLTPITLNSSNSSGLIKVINKGNVDLSNLSIPQINVSGASGKFDIAKSDCPNVLAPFASCTYKVSYSPPATAEVLSGNISGITANYTSAQKTYNFTDQLAINTVFNESVALSFSTTQVTHSSKWSQSLSQTSSITVTNTSSSQIDVNFSSGETWIKSSDCGGSISPHSSCNLVITTNGIAPGLTDSSALGILKASYSFSGRAASQAISVGYIIKAKPVISPNLTITPSEVSQFSLATNDKWQGEFVINNNSTATNGGDTKVFVKIASLVPSSTAELLFVANIGGSCQESGDYISIPSGTSCKYTVVVNSQSTVGSFIIPNVVEYNYAIYSDSSTEPVFSGVGSFNQGFEVTINPRQARLNIENVATTNNFNYMQLHESYTNTYIITNVGDAAIVGNLTFSDGGLPGNITVNGFSNCNNLASGANCGISVTYTPTSIITNKSLESASVGFNDGINVTHSSFPAEVVHAYDPGNPSIKVSTSITGCGIGDGTSFMSTCYLNSGSQAKSFNLTVTLTNIGGRAADQFYFKPEEFSTAWNKQSSSCGDDSKNTITLAKDATCKINYTMNGDSAFLYDLSQGMQLGSVNYTFGTTEIPGQSEILLDSDLYITVSDPSLSISLNPDYVKIESSNLVSFVLSNWYQGVDTSAKINFNSINTTLAPIDGFSFTDGANSCTFNISNKEVGSICDKVLMADSPTVVGSNNYSMSITGNWELAQSYTVPFTVKSPSFKNVAAGGYHSCGISASGHAYCWGFNQYGQLGNGNGLESVAFPTVVKGNIRFASLALGTYHTCGIATDGAAYCWGHGLSGQLGNGLTSDQSSPKPVSTPTKFMIISAGLNSTCGVGMDNNAYCWGENGYGQLGTGKNNSELTPAPVVETLSGKFTNVITVGANHACAVAAAGQSYCWGKNDSGQLGSGMTSIRESEPVLVVGSHNFTSLNAGNSHVCGIDDQKNAYCWGNNINGQLGINDPNNQAIPQQISDVTLQFTQISAGFISTCGIATDGNGYCWGDNRYGQLGDGLEFDQSFTPVPVDTGLSGGFLVQITSGNYHVCSISFAGDSYCWGLNDDGQLGNGSRNQANMPSPLK